MEKLQAKKIYLASFFDLRKILIFLIFALLASLLIHNATALNQDLGRHIETGKIIWQTHQVPKTNLFSYTQPNFPFIDHHWLSQVVFYILYSLVGIKGLIIFSALTIFISFAIIFRLAWNKKYPIICGLVALLSIGLLIERTDIRPEIFGFLFFSLFLWILKKNKEKFSSSIWLLLPLQLLWVNMHISFIFGLALVFFFFLDRLWARRKEIHLAAKKHKIDRYIFKLVLIGISLGLFCFLNPSGWRGALYPLNIFSNYGYTIAENQSPFFLQTLMHDISITFFKLTISSLILGFLLNLKRQRLFYFFCAFFFFILAWSAIRNLPFLGFVVLPFLVQNFTGFRENYARYFEAWRKLKIRPLIYFAAYLILLFFLAASIICVVSGRFYDEQNKDQSFGLGVPQYARAAADFVKTNMISGNVFNNFDIGSFLDWQFYPERRVFVDSRPEAYSIDFLQKIYIPMQNDAATWQKYADQVYNINYIFFAHTDATPWAGTFINQISGNQNWKLIYLNPQVVVWLKNSKENQDLIKKFELTPQNLKAETQKYLVTKDWLDLFNLGKFLSQINQSELAAAAYLRVLQLNPESKEAAFMLGQLYAQKDFARSVEFFEKAISSDKKFGLAYLSLGQVYYDHGDFSLAREIWKKGLEVDPGNKTMQGYLDNMGLIPFVELNN